MTEWEVFGVIVALASFVLAVVTPIIKLNTTITKLSGIVDSMARDLGSLTERNAKTHERIFNELGDHEKRITILETKESTSK